MALVVQFLETFAYLQLPYAEHADEDLAKVFEETLEQIETRLTENRQKHSNSPFFLFGKKPTPVRINQYSGVIKIINCNVDYK